MTRAGQLPDQGTDSVKDALLPPMDAQLIPFDMRPNTKESFESLMFEAEISSEHLYPYKVESSSVSIL